MATPQARHVGQSRGDARRDIVLSMLVAGLIFAGVALLGDPYQRSARKRHNAGGPATRPASHVVA